MELLGIPTCLSGQGYILLTIWLCIPMAHQCWMQIPAITAGSTLCSPQEKSMLHISRVSTRRGAIASTNQLVSLENSEIRLVLLRNHDICIIFHNCLAQ